MLRISATDLRATTYNQEINLPVKLEGCGIIRLTNTIKANSYVMVGKSINLVVEGNVEDNVFFLLSKKSSVEFLNKPPKTIIVELEDPSKKKGCIVVELDKFIYKWSKKENKNKAQMHNVIMQSGDNNAGIQAYQITSRDDMIINGISVPGDLIKKDKADRKIIQQTFSNDMRQTTEKKVDIICGKYAVKMGDHSISMPGAHNMTVVTGKNTTFIRAQPSIKNPDIEIDKVKDNNSTTGNTSQHTDASSNATVITQYGFLGKPNPSTVIIQAGKNCSVEQYDKMKVNGNYSM